MSEVQNILCGFIAQGSGSKSSNCVCNILGMSKILSNRKRASFWHAKYDWKINTPKNGMIVYRNIPLIALWVSANANICEILIWFDSVQVHLGQFLFQWKDNGAPERHAPLQKNQRRLICLQTARYCTVNAWQQHKINPANQECTPCSTT